MKKIILTSQAPKPIGPYAQAIEAKGFIFLSGQIPIDPASGKLVEGDMHAQTERVLKNLEAILWEAGSSLPRVVKTTVFLTDLNNYAAVNEVYARYFPEEPPARATVQVAGLPAGAKIEIDAIALTGK
ncbi:MAG: RidA family protein [Bryobacteraceae bacterium]|nr:RidA family protein [Bryobacteraceae bacterium]